MTTRTLVDYESVGQYNIAALGGTPDGSTDCSPVLLAAIDTASAAGGGEILFPRTPAGGTYRFLSGIPTSRLGPGITFKGIGWPTLSKEFDGDFFTTFGAYQKWKDLYFDCNGGTYTGALIRFRTNDTQQQMTRCVVVNGADAILLFEDIGGVGCNIRNNHFTLHASHLASGAVVKRTVSAVDTQAAPRHFKHNFTGAFTWFVIADGFQGAYFDHCYSAGMTIGDNSLGCTVNNCRLAVPVGMTAHISGNSTLMQSCEIGGDLTVDAGFVYGTFANNEMDPSKTFTDNSIKTGGDDQPRVEDPRLAVGIQALVQATADLQVGDAKRTGRLVIEDAGASSCNLVVYKGSKRYKVALTEL